MRISVTVCLTYVGLCTLAAFPGEAFSQVPTTGSEPVLRVPSRAAPGALPANPQAAEPAAAPAPAPAAGAPAEPAPVSAAPPPSGVTQLPPAAPPPTTSSSSSAATAKYSYGAANFSLNLDGISAGFLHAVEGGAAVGTVVVDNSGPDNIRKKHVAGVKYEALSFDVGVDSKPVLEWITSAWEGKPSRKNGSVQVADPNYNVVSERQFTNALITGTTVPALDQGLSKKPLLFTVTVAPEHVREVAGSGKVQGSTLKGGKQLLSSNFRFEMGDLETNFVRRIDPFTVGQKVTEDDVGEMRVAEKQPNTLEFPNLKVTMAARPSPNWEKWREELIKVRGGEVQERNGAIVFLDQSFTKELGRISLFNCGLIRLGTDRLEAGKEKASTVTADLYCEKMELAIKS